MDKPVHTLQEWQEMDSTNANWRADRILRDWALDREILEARITGMEKDIYECEHNEDFHGHIGYFLYPEHATPEPPE